MDDSGEKYTAGTARRKRELRNTEPLPSPAVLTARCKINVSLHITGRRPDGYHEIDSVFYPLRMPADLLHIRPRLRGEGLNMTCSGRGSEDVDPEQNTLTRAYAAFAGATGFAPPIDLHLEKGIPTGAGLGGGSSDAASLLLWLNRQTQKPLSAPELAQAAVSIGADVPFFLYNCPCRVRGTGELIEPCATDPLEGLHILLVCPDIHISTPWAYGVWDALPQKEKETKSLTVPGFKSSGINSCVKWIANDFEVAVFPHYPQLSAIKQTLLEQGALAAVMSGSGASIAGIFPSRKNAAGAAQVFTKAVTFM